MKKNIMVVVSDLSGGGAERVATNLASSLAKTENVILVVEHINIWINSGNNRFKNAKRQRKIETFLAFGIGKKTQKGKKRAQHYTLYMLLTGSCVSKCSF